MVTFTLLNGKRRLLSLVWPGEWIGVGLQTVPLFRIGGTSDEFDSILVEMDEQVPLSVRRHGFSGLTLELSRVAKQRRLE